MSILTISLPDDWRVRLEALAKARGMSINKLRSELSTIALVEFGAETRFRAMVDRGNIDLDIAALDKLDACFEDSK